MQTRHQSTNHVLLIEPVAFTYNQETGVDNAFQNKNINDTAQRIAGMAREEMLGLQKLFEAAGVNVTKFLGQKDCPDDVFPNNWVSTTQDGAVFLYPMATPSRRRERRADVIDFLNKQYDYTFDLSRKEAEGKSLEGTGVFVLDHISKTAYVARSKRTDDELIDLWCRITDYKPLVFDSC